MTKYLLGITLMLAGIQLHAQTNRIARQAVEIYENTDPLLEGVSMEVPKEFEDASVVALASISLDIYYGGFDKRGSISYYRLLLKINDTAARDKYSIVELNSKLYRLFADRDEQVYGLIIIKPSGEKLVINLEELERNANDEIAIPNIEVGDILDLGLKFTEIMTAQSCNAPHFKTLNEDYPVAYGFQRYVIPSGFYLNYQTQEGSAAPQKNLELSSKNQFIFDMEYRNLHPLSDEVWSPEARRKEAIKAQVCYCPLFLKSRAPFLIGQTDEVKSSTTYEDRARYLKAHTGLIYKTKFDEVKFFDTWYKKNFPKGTQHTTEEYMNLVYYHYRFYKVIYNLKDNNFQRKPHTGKMRTTRFFQLMGNAALKRDIPFQRVFTTDKSISSFEDIILVSEFEYLCRYQTESGEWKYLENPYAFQTINQISPSLQGQRALAHTYGADSLQEIIIPETSAKDNLYRLYFLISPDLETSNAVVDATSKATGAFKFDLGKTILSGVDYHEDVIKAMLPEGQSDVMMKSGKIPRGMLNSKDRIEQSEGDKLLEMKNLLSEDFDVEEYTSFKIINSGVVSASDSLIYREHYTIKDVVEKAGPSYVINLSKIAFNQISFTDEEKAERINDIYINYPKTYEYLYHINIPEGYKAYGLDTFKESVDLKYGSVEMHAEEKDNQVVVYLKKVYKESFIPKEEWGAMMEFLGPAMKLNDARIVLKKE